AERANRAVHTAIALALAGGAVIGVCGSLGARTLLTWMRTPEAVLPHATDYLRVFFGGSATTLVYNMGAGILRARGDSKRPFYLLVAGTVLNFALDLLFVVNFGWGVAGVAWATVFSQALSAAGVWRCLAREEEALRLELRKVRFDPLLLRNIVAVGLPAGLQGSMYSISNAVVQAAVNSLGVSAVAAWTVSSKIDALYWQTMAAFGMALSTFAGQNFGAQRYDRVKKSIRDCSVLATLFTALYVALALSFARVWIGVFTADAEVIGLGVTVMFIMMPWYFSYIPIETLACGIRGTGDSLRPTAIMAVCICAPRLLWIAFVLPHWRTIESLSWCYPASWVIAAGAFIVYYFKSGWLERSARRAGHGAIRA
ncbi:MAG: MATE family efflux transporter, partial [Pyramidobacter sp.]|nr:MATE family efflux transporter [Pyramidobacter sp.]